MKRISAIFLVAVVLVFAASFFFHFTACSSKKLHVQDFNLLVITLDTTRADHIGAYGYSQAQTPNLDRLARQGIMFKECYSPVPLTLPAHCSLFTGRYPLGHSVRDNGAYYLPPAEHTLAEELKALPGGCDSFAVIASFVLMSKFGLNQGFDRYDDSLKSSELITNYDSEIRAEQVYGNFNRWFSQQKEKTSRFFAWVHFYDPHASYDPPAPFKDRFSNDLSGRYDGELAYTDSFVGKIIDDLQQADKLKNTLVVIVGDHGEAFGEHNEQGHSFFCYQENLRVPLIFYNPVLFKENLTVSQRVSLIDIMPTILDLYGLPLSTHLQGESFKSMLLGEEEKKSRSIYIESMHGKEEMGWAPLTGIIDEQYKYISLPEPELYDLQSDPEEKENLFQKKNYLAKELDKKLMRIVKASSIPRRDKSGEEDQSSYSQRQLTASDRKHLQTLGYISAFSGKSASNMDPKKGILLKNKFSLINELIENNRIDEAKRELNHFLAENSEHLPPQYFGSWNRIYREKDQFDLITENWKQAIITFPKNDHFKINLALHFFHQEQLEHSLQVLEQIFEYNDRFTQAYILKSKILERQAHLSQALEYMERAVALEPENVSLKISLARLLSKLPDIPRTNNICDQLLKEPAISRDHDLKSRLGVILTEIHRDDIALKLLTEVIESGKATAETWNYRGILHFRKNQFQPAEAAYQKSLKMDAQSALTYNNLGTLYLSRFLKEKTRPLHTQALTAFNNALKIDSHLASALNGRGSAYMFANRIPEALKDWQKAIVSKPDFIDVYFNIAIAYLQLKDKKNASHWLNQCKQNYYSQMTPAAQKRLTRLIQQSNQ